MAVIDVCTVNNEHDLWNLHYNILEPYVDEFIVVQFTETFSGKEREWMPIDALEYPKAKNMILGLETWEKYRELAESSPNTVGADHWKREFMQKESIKDCLTHLKDDDIVFIGDVDEIWHKNAIKRADDLVKLPLRVYTYYLNNRSTEQFWGTLVGRWGSMKNETLNHLRSDSRRLINSTHINPNQTEYRGWHFTSMAHKLEQKLKDSYTHESYATPEVLNNLAYNVENMRDFLGRDFTYRLDESEWPQYLKDNREKYAHLCK